MTLLRLAYCGSEEGLTALQTAAERADLPVEIAAHHDMAALLKSINSNMPRCVVVDVRGFDEAAHGKLGSLLKLLDGKDVPLSVLFERLGNTDIRDIVFGPVFIDQALEIRSNSDVIDAAATIVSHAVNSAPGARERTGAREGGTTKVGAIYVIGPQGWRSARTRSLVSHNMSGFSADLRAAVARLRTHPLRKVMPWDPTDSARDRKVERKDGTWDLDARSEETPNLESVMSAFASVEARARLAGAMPEDAAWREAWKTNPPLLLLSGESGTGKTLVAGVIADLLTPRAPGAETLPRFEKINSAGLTLAGFEHRVHGSAPRSWTGIDEVVIGQLTRGAHGVVFFDEIGDLQPEVQAALLTFFDERLIRPMRVPPFNGFQHIIAATNRDLEEGANQQWFRNDLLARFTLRLEIPPLRERGEHEIRQLVDFLLQDPDINAVDADGSYQVSSVSNAALEALCAGEYRDGNFRELAEAVQAAVRAATRRYSPVLALEDLRLATESHYRSDKDSSRVRVRDVGVPAHASVVTVESESEIRLLARREGRAIATDANGTSWVLPADTYYRT